MAIPLRLSVRAIICFLATGDLRRTPYSEWDTPVKQKLQLSRLGAPHNPTG